MAAELSLGIVRSYDVDDLPDKININNYFSIILVTIFGIIPVVLIIVMHGLIDWTLQKKKHAIKGNELQNVTNTYTNSTRC